MTYGFIFPKQGKTVDDAVKDLAWRDDQTVFLARPPVYKTVTIPSGTNLDTYNLLAIDFKDVVHGDFHVFRTFLRVGSYNYAIDPKNYFAIGGVNVVAYSQGGQLSDETSSTDWTERVGILFERQTATTTTSAVEVTMTTYLVEILL